MNSTSSYLFFLFLFCSLHTFLNAQTENDSLAKYNFKELEKKFYDTRFTNKDLCKIYAEKYLFKAKLSVDKVKISRGYYHMAIFYYVVSDKDLTSLKYTDSIIEICKDCNDKDFPALGYYTKGAYQYDLGKNKEALNIFFEALRILKKNKNIQFELDVRNAIIALKSNWLENEETLKYELELFEFIQKQDNYKVYLNYEYTLSVGNLIIEYINNNRYQDALELSFKAIFEHLQTDRFNYHDFVSLAGEAQYYLQNYQAAIDSLQKGLSYRKDHGKAMSNYYLGKSYHKLKQPEKARFHFFKTDSIYQATKDIFPEMRNVYEHIIEYYKSKNDVKNQIKYYDRLIETDKIIDSTYTYVTETVNKKFDTPQAIAERNRLLEEAKANESTWKYGFGAISITLVAALGVVIVLFRRQKQYKQRFESVMNTSASLSVPGGKNTKIKTTSIERSRNALHINAEALKGKKEIGVPQEIVDSILSQLQKFETTQQFIKPISLTDLAKKLGTNPKYLSKVINGHYQKSFSSYISELRIEYVISRLKTDSKFRSYTIKAIGKEAGFGNTESFSKAFHKTTGIKPSYFIKQLHKRLEN